MIFVKRMCALLAVVMLAIAVLQTGVAYATGNLDNTTKGWGYKRGDKGERPEIPADIVKLFAKYDAYITGAEGEKKLYLTFDEGYENGQTTKILDVLRDNQVSAAFFITGHYYDTQKELIKRMVDEGHIVGNHTINHPSLPSLTREGLNKEVLSLGEKFKQEYGVDMEYIRPPMGEYSESTLAYLKDNGYKTVMWSLTYVDWDVKNQRGVEYAYNQVVNQFHDGAIILLHAVSPDNANALDKIIKRAKALGYSFATLDELSGQARGSVVDKTGQARGSVVDKTGQARGSVVDKTGQARGSVVDKTGQSYVGEADGGDIVEVAPSVERTRHPQVFHYIKNNNNNYRHESL